MNRKAIPHQFLNLLHILIKLAFLQSTFGFVQHLALCFLRRQGFGTETHHIPFQLSK